MFKKILCATGLVGMVLLNGTLLSAKSNPAPLPPSPCQIDRCWDWKSVECKQTIKNCCGGVGVWFPEGPQLFRPFLADPRQITYSTGWRFNDHVLEKNIIDVSFGDSFPIYQWWHALPWDGKMRLDLEGAVWAIFSPCEASAPLINADYYCALPITYRCDKWSFKLRISHISSHIGDEFILNNSHKPYHGTTFKRLNPSAEYLDFFTSYDMTDDIRLYGGVGYVLHFDNSYPMGRFYAEAGAELHFRPLGYVDNCHQFYGIPFYGMHFRYRKDMSKHLDSTYILGYEWGKMTGLCRLMRVYLQYHNGYSLEGQFGHQRTNYMSIRASYGF